QFASYVDLNFLSLVCELSGNVGHADILFQIRRRTSRGYSTDALAIDYYFLIIAGDASLSYFKSNQPFANAGFFLLRQGLATDKVALVQFADPTEVRFQQRCVFIDLVPVKRHAGFKAKRVAGREAAG